MVNTNSNNFFNKRNGISGLANSSGVRKHALFGFGDYRPMTEKEKHDFRISNGCLKREKEYFSISPREVREDNVVKIAKTLSLRRKK